MTTHLEFSPEIRDILNHERYHHPVPLVQRRMEVLWLKSHGLPHALIAQLGGVSENTMREYFALYEAGGVEQLKEVHWSRPGSDLPNHTPTLEAHFRAHLPATIKEAQHDIEVLTGVTRSATQVREFLKKTSSALPPGRDDSGQSRSRRTSRLSRARAAAGLR